MIPGRLLIHTVTWLRPGTRTDEYGDTVDDWTSPVAVDIAGRLQQVTTREVVHGRDATITEWRLFTNERGVRAGHRVRFRGHTWTVDGIPSVSADGVGDHHAEVLLKQVGD